MDIEESKEEKLKEAIKEIQEENLLWCPNCKKFMESLRFTLYGKDSLGKDIESLETEKIEELIGYRYQCKKCGMRIDSSINLGEVKA